MAWTPYPLPAEKLATIWWQTGSTQDSWATIAHWCYGAWSMAVNSDDRSDLDLLRAIAWDHAGITRESFNEVAA
jgi:hypothetical protein